MSNQVLIEGAGGHAKVVIDCIRDQGMQLVAIFDPKGGDTFLGAPVFQHYDPGFEKEAGFVVAVGNNELRKEAVKKISHPFINIVHSSALISPMATVGKGCMILHRTIIQNSAKVGNHVILNTGSQVDHDCIIADFVHIGPRAVLCGNVSVGEGTLIGAGATILPGIKIGKWVTVGSGAVVTKNVSDGEVVAGVPAKIITASKKH